MLLGLNRPCVGPLSSEAAPPRSRAATAPPTFWVAPLNLGRRGHRTRHSLLGVGDLGAQIRTRARLHQTHELVVERGRPGSKGLEFLSVVAEQRRDRGRYLVRAGSRN